MSLLQNIGATVLAVAMAVPVLPAQADVVGRRAELKCADWYASEYLEPGRTIRINRISTVPNGFEAQGTAVDDGDTFQGTIRFGVVSEDAPRHGDLTLGFYEIDEKRRHAFVVARRDFVKLYTPSGDSFTVRGGILTGNNGIAGDDYSIAPMYCVKVAGEKFLVAADVDGDVETPAGGLAEALAVPPVAKDEGADFGMAAEKPGLADLFKSETPEAPNPAKVPMGRNIVIGIGAENAIAEALSPPSPRPAGGGLSAIANEAKSRENSIARIAKPKVPAAPESVPVAVTPVAPDVNMNLCQLTSDALLSADWLADAPAYQLAGALRQIDSIVPYWMLPSLSRDINGFEKSVSIAATPSGSLERMSLPIGVSRQLTLDGQQIIPLKLVDWSPVQLIDAAPSERAEINGINLAVFGDPHMISISGLAEFEQEINARYGKVPLAIDWYDVDKSGTVAPRARFDSMNALYDSLPARDDAVYLTSQAKISNFLTGFTDALATSPEPVDMVFWVTEGHPLPHATPDLMAKAITRAKTTGNIRRDDLGRLKPWFYVLAGKNAVEYALYYLIGPMVADTPTSYYLEEGDRKAGRRQLLSNFDRPMNRLERILSEKNDDTLPNAPVRETLDTEALTFDASSVVDRLGLVISAAAAASYNTDLRTSGLMMIALGKGINAKDIPNVDNEVMLPSLLLMETDEYGDPRNMTLQPALLARLLAKTGLDRNADDLLLSASNLNKIGEALEQRAAANPNCGYYYIPGNLLGWQLDRP